MRIIYLGSPESAIAPLKYLLSDKAKKSGIEVVGVVSQPAKKIGRGKKNSIPQDPPLAAWAKDHQLLVLQPKVASESQFLQELRDIAPDVMVTCAYGQILTEDFLKIPKRATINIHPSKLPLYRGATPVPSTILAGLQNTSVSILFTVKKLDAGAIILQKDFPISDDETSADLTCRLFKESGPLLLESLLKLKNPSFEGVAQDENKVIKCRKLTKDSGEISWKKSTNDIYNQYRAFEPWPGSYTFLHGKRIKLEKMSRPLQSQSLEWQSLNFGDCVFDPKTLTLSVKCLDGFINIDKLKPEGSRSIDPRSFWNGYRSKTSDLKFDL